VTAQVATLPLVTRTRALGRFGDGDVASIVDHLERGRPAGELVSGDEAFSAQPGTGAWEGFGR